MQPFAPTYIPKIGIANVTKATAFPPPPPTLNPYTDYQPMDTAMGNYIQTQFVEPPTVTPPPSQSALNLAYGCPALITFPSTLYVNAATGCGSVRENSWTDPSENIQMNWTESCSPQESAMPTVTYHVPHPTDATKKGDLFGFSKSRFSLYGTQMDLLDCGLNKLWTVEEKVYHHTGHMDETLCRKWGSCDGTIYLQYFIYDNKGALQATTAYIPIFASSFSMVNPGGLKIADFSRMGGWPPKDVCSEYKKTWLVKFAGAPPGPFGDVTQRWPVAMMATMMSLRDEYRKPDGMVTASLCEVYDLTAITIALIVVSALIVTAACIILKYFTERIATSCFAVEDAVFPKQMHKPSFFDN